MRLDTLITRRDWAEFIQQFGEPQEGPGAEKGEDAIMVHAFVVKGHWRKRPEWMKRGTVKAYLNNGKARKKK